MGTAQWRGLRASGRSPDLVPHVGRSVGKVWGLALIGMRADGDGLLPFAPWQRPPRRLKLKHSNSSK